MLATGVTPSGHRNSLAGRTRDAVLQLRQAIVLPPNNPDLHALLSQAMETTSPSMETVRSPIHWARRYLPSQGTELRRRRRSSLTIR
jgi:hypothetical protein